MLDKLYETGKSFKDDFTEEYGYGAALGIKTDKENEYIQWIAKTGVYSEAKLKQKYPKMTEQIIKIVDNKSKYLEDYNVIMGYLESVKELG